MDVGFHRLRRAEAVQRVDDEKGVTQPAEAVVPVAGGVGGLRDRGRVGGHDRARLLVGAEVQRDRRAHHRGLPFERRGEVARPVEPVVAGAIEEFPAGGVDAGHERLVLAEDQAHRPGERKGDFVDDVGQRRVGRQAQHLRTADVANVVGAADDHLGRTAVIVGRPHSDRDPRNAGHRLDPPDDLRRTERSLVEHEPRSEIRDAQRCAVAAGQDRLDDRRVSQVVRIDAPQVIDDDVAESLLLVARQQAREHRIAVEAREAPPDDARLAVDKCGDATVPDEGKVERLPQRGRVAHAEAPPRAKAARQPRTSLGLANVATTPGR